MSTAVSHISALPIGVLSLIFNIPIFAFGIWYEGRSFGYKSLYATVALSVFLDIFAFVPPITNDLLLSAIFGGAMSGFGLGLVFTQQSTTGGTDIIAKVLSGVFKHLSIGSILLAVDAIIIAFATVVFADLRTALYSVVALFISTKVIDTMLEGIDYAKMALIISDEYMLIGNAINKDLVRGATVLSGTGAYSKAQKNTLLCTLRNREIPKLKELVYKYDESAFVIVADVREVLGEGFKIQNMQKQ